MERIEGGRIIDNINIVKTPVYNLNKPQRTAPAEIEDLNENADIIENALLEKLNLSGGTLTGDLIAQNSTDYTTSRVRNCHFQTADLTSGSSSLASGAIVFVYE